LWGSRATQYASSQGNSWRLPRSKGGPVRLMVGHRLKGTSLLLTGDLVEGRAHLDRAITLYDPIKHRALATRFGQDVGVAILSWRLLALWLLGYPEKARADTDQALEHAREIGQAAALMYALALTPYTDLLGGNHVAGSAKADELVRMADEKGASLWRAYGKAIHGWVLAVTGKPSDAVEIVSSSITAPQNRGWRNLLLVVKPKTVLKWHQP
jgi:hypothetical protein